MQANIVLDVEASGQYMAGGDLRSALDQDAEESGLGEERRLGWYARGPRPCCCASRAGWPTFTASGYVLALESEGITSLLMCGTTQVR